MENRKAVMACLSASKEGCNSHDQSDSLILFDDLGSANLPIQSVPKAAGASANQ